MKELARDKRMTVREVAEVLGCTPEAVKRHIRELFPDLMQKGKTAYVTEAQVTVILEYMKKSKTGGAFHKRENGDTYNNVIAGTETGMTDEFRLAMLYKQKADIADEALELEQKIRLQMQAENIRLKLELVKETEAKYNARNGLDHYQRIAEAAGLAKSDKDDLYDTYPHWELVRRKKSIKGRSKL